MSHRPVSAEFDRGKGYTYPTKFFEWLFDCSEIPLASAELRRIAGWYPVAFKKQDSGFTLIMPLTAPGCLNPLVNEKTGKWIGNALPNALKLYPYSIQILGEAGVSLCIDQNAEAQFTIDGPNKLFTETGVKTDFHDKMVGALEQRKHRLQLDSSILEALQSHDLFIPWELNLGTDDHPIVREDLFTIDERRLNELGSNYAAVIFSEGGANLVYGHLYSKLRSKAPASFLLKKKKLEENILKNNRNIISNFEESFLNSSDDLVDFSGILDTAKK